MKLAFINNRIDELDATQNHLASEARENPRDDHSVDIAAKAIVHLEHARQILLAHKREVQ
jgi:hypothetical protein